MHYSTVKRERQVQRHAWILAVALHLSLAAVLYFKATSGSGTDSKNSPTKVNKDKAPPTASASVQIFA